MAIGLAFRFFKLTNIKVIQIQSQENLTHGTLLLKFSPYFCDQKSDRIFVYFQYF
jgi:hypothetical protein